MADVSDVVTAIQSVISAAVYPNGTSSASIGGVDAYVVGGWPTTNNLERALANKQCVVSVWPQPGERNTTRYTGQNWTQASLNTPTLTLTTSGQVVTVGGTIPPVTNPHNLVIFVNKYPYAYRVLPNDTLATITTSFAQLIGVNVQGVFPSGGTLTFPGNAVLGACRVGVTGTSVSEITRQERQFLVTIWADTPQHRSALAKVIDPALKKLTFLMLPDDSAGRIRAAGSRDSDASQKQNLYRRDLFYTVEYATLLEQTNTQITAIEVSLVSGNTLGTWQADSSDTSDSSKNTADAIPLTDPSDWSADEVDVSMDSSELTSDSTPAPGVNVFI